MVSMNWEAKDLVRVLREPRRGVSPNSGIDGETAVFAAGEGHDGVAGVVGMLPVRLDVLGRKETVVELTSFSCEGVTVSSDEEFATEDAGNSDPELVVGSPAPLVGELDIGVFWESEDVVGGDGGN